MSETDISYAKLLYELYNRPNQLCHVWRASIAVSQGARRAAALNFLVFTIYQS